MAAVEFGAADHHPELRVARVVLGRLPPCGDRFVGLPFLPRGGAFLERLLVLLRFLLGPDEEGDDAEDDDRGADDDEIAMAGEGTFVFGFNGKSSCDGPPPTEL
jgi:hypothetical protein